jgi:Skp family chaperone for outer membrane proteins
MSLTSNRVRRPAPRSTARSIWLAGATAALALSAAPASAQPALAPTYGPPTPGVCLFAQAEALSHSKAGVSADQQLKQFAVGIEAELTAERSAIYNDDRALAAQRASLSAADYQQRTEQLRQRYAELDHTRSLRDAQLNLTRNQAAEQVMKVLKPSLADTITARKCSFVLERSVTYGAADALDITGAVIQRMDALLSFVPLRLAPPEAVQNAR